MGRVSAADGADMTAATGTALPVRRPSFPFDPHLRADWNPKLPEFAYAANSVSLLMPYAEPYFVKSVRAALPLLEGDLVDVARDYVAQEASHHAQHQRFNQIITAGHPMLQRLERRMGSVYRWLSRTRSLQFNLAFAAGSEAIAYALARWSDPRLHELFDDADPVARDLYWWHLAEEVEHKSAAFDVYAAVDGSKLRYAFAMVLSLNLLGLFTMAATLTMLVSSRRVFNPLAWWHLTKWSLSMVWKIFPDLAVSALPSHHPTDFTDPIYLSAWLGSFDAATATNPLVATRG